MSCQFPHGICLQQVQEVSWLLQESGKHEEEEEEEVEIQEVSWLLQESGKQEEEEEE